jgi:hypothetical protein
MRRMRNRDATKVWHNPEILSASRGRASASSKPAENGEPTADERGMPSESRAALEALFAPRKSVEVDHKAADPRARSLDDRATDPLRVPSSKPGRIVLTPQPDTDPRSAERQKLLAKLLRAAGRPAVSQAANDFLRAGFVFPDEQEVQLQLLEHANEEHVCSAIDRLAAILAAEVPQRRAVLESRLRRIEQFADEASTRAAAERLRRQVSGRADGPSSPSAS